ncbi:MAG: OmpA family protein [Desulfuromusa sp.]|nr:OmpA family protein [Desulfuromusa sp.]
MRQLQNLLLFFALIALVSSCAPVMQPPLQPLERGASTTAGGKYAPKVNNFEVLLDASLSMNEGGKNYFLVAREVVRRINQGIPTDLSYNGALRSVGHSSYQSENTTELLYDMNGYNQAGFHDGLGKIKYVGGPTPMAAALQAAGNDLKSASGRSALILVSDGLNIDGAPAAAKNLKMQLGDNLCIYTIAIGRENNGAGQDMMKELASIGQCGFATTATDLADDTSMEKFINQVFLTQPAPVVKAAPAPVPARDSDGDGVMDPVDNCPNTPKGAPVNDVGCLLDSDGDGVFDYMDQCPGTPEGVSVDVYGCPTKLTLHINFGHDSSTVGAEFDSEIAKAAQCINDYPGNTVIIEGHTDSRGAAAYNLNLSEQRATAVKNRLLEKFNIKESRLIAQGFGESHPVADNKTAGGRSLNRRVEVGCGATE